MTLSETPLHALVATHGSFQRREALACGVDDGALRRGLRRGNLVRVRHGSYTFAEDWAGLDTSGRHLVHSKAVLRSLGRAVAASHHTACLLHGMDLWDVDLDHVHVTRLDGGAGRTARDVVHHEGLSLDGDLEEISTHLAVRPARAALESALLSGVERGLAAVDSGLRRRLFTPHELDAQHALMRSWPGAGPLQLVTRLADGRAGSVGESRARYLFWARGLPSPELQFHVHDHNGRLIGITDFAWPEAGLLGEFDGKVKYQRYLRPGEEPGDAVFREKQREDLLRRLTGWSMIRLTWSDLHDASGTAARVRSMMRSVA